MKRVIVCEGFHDGLFINTLITKLGFDMSKVKIFNQASVSMEDKKHAETTVLKQFINTSYFNKYDTLIKLEGGKDSAIKLFSRELVHYLNNNTNIILILDMDNSNFSNKKSLLKNLVHKSFGQSTPLDLDFKEMNKMDHLHYSVCKVNITNTGNNLGKFHMVLFKKTLETACGIIKKKDSLSVKTNKLTKFIVDKNLTVFFSPIIN